MKTGYQRENKPILLGRFERHQYLVERALLFCTGSDLAKGRCQAVQLESTAGIDPTRTKLPQPQSKPCGLLLRPAASSHVSGPCFSQTGEFSSRKNLPKVSGRRFESVPDFFFLILSLLGRARRSLLRSDLRTSPGRTRHSSRVC